MTLIAARQAIFRFAPLWLVIVLIGLVPHHLRAEDALLTFTPSVDGPLVKIFGDGDDEWRMQSSSDLQSWTTLTNFFPLLSKGSNPPARLLQDVRAEHKFYRTVRTEGLYDLSVFRTFRLTFTNSNWVTLLTNGRNTGSNTPALLTADNGAFKTNVGARYKGNTSFTMAGSKKSINLEFDYIETDQDMMGFDTINLNNAYGDETIMREAIYFSVMGRYTVSPLASMVRLFINGADWGVYSLAEQENKQLLARWFPSTDGDRWRTPNAPSTTSAFVYLGRTNISTYRPNYELKNTSEADTNVAWMRLITAITTLTNTQSSAGFQDKIESVFAVDRWLWFLAGENVFADDDSYFNKGADFSFYFEPETGLIHPIEHDGNEAFFAGDATLTPVAGSTESTRPLLVKLLGFPEYRQRYLAHMRTILKESFNTNALYPLITNLNVQSVAAITADTRKGYSMTAYNTDLTALKTFIRTRHAYLTNHAELRPLPPLILEVFDPAVQPGPSETATITARVEANGTNGVSSVWLYHRPKSYGRFARAQMFDDGAHGDAAADDGLYGGQTTAYPAGTRVRYYVEARSANPAKAAVFSPARAEEDTYGYRVGLASAPDTPVVINELMAAKNTTVPDPQNEFDDWIELRNITDAPVDISGWHLSDETNNPRKWQFPAGTIIPADGFLVIWADEDGKDTPGLHASFKLDADGEDIYLTDTDSNFNTIRDRIRYPSQAENQTYGRSPTNPDLWSTLKPTPAAPNARE